MVRGANSSCSGCEVNLVNVPREVLGSFELAFDKRVDDELRGFVRRDTPLLGDVRRRVTDGMVTWAECGGLLWLARSLDGLPLSGVVPAVGRMTDRLTLGYRRARVLVPTPLAGPGVILKDELVAVAKAGEVALSV